jgi:hypothetical protein
MAVLGDRGEAGSHSAEAYEVGEGEGGQVMTAEEKQWPKWFECIRVQQRTILGSALPPDYVLSFGPRNVLTPQKTEKRAESEAQDVKRWLWMFIQRDVSELQRKARAFDLICEAEGMSTDEGLEFAENHPATAVRS